MNNDEIRLIPTSQFTIEQLTAIYNQTRVDYLVPMPMNAKTPGGLHYSLRC